MEKSYIQIKTDARKDLLSSYGIHLESIPFMPFPDLKDLPKRNWVDQHGDDEYQPENPIFKAYETNVDFVYRGNLDTARVRIYDFMTYIKNGDFSIWDVWKQKGLRCRYVSYVDNAYYNKTKNIVKFTLRLKVNNPLCYGVRVSNNLFSGVASCDMTIHWATGLTETYGVGATIYKLFQTDCEFGIIVPSKVANVETITTPYPAPMLTESGTFYLLGTGAINFLN